MSSFQPQNMQNTIPYIPPQNSIVPPVSTGYSSAVPANNNTSNAQPVNNNTAAPVTNNTTSAQVGSCSSGYYGCYPPQYYCTSPATTPGPAVEININNPTSTTGPVYLPHTQQTPMYCTPMPVQTQQAMQPVQQPQQQLPQSPAPTTPLEPPKQAEPPKEEEKKTAAPLTDDYIRSLENYLNNPNSEIRLSGAKQLLNTFKEDKSRKDDPALTALLNKALADPNQKVRLMALACLDADYAEGNELTLQRLDALEKSGGSYNQDAVTAAEIKLKKAGRYINPNTTQPPKKPSKDKESKSEVGKNLDVTAG